MSKYTVSQRAREPIARISSHNSLKDYQKRIIVKRKKEEKNEMPFIYINIFYKVSDS
jgi:hypothetical protein